MNYADHIRSKTCIICPNPSVLAHQRILGGGGTSLKPIDLHALPLCDTHHKEEHRGSITFWLKYFPEYDATESLKEKMTERELEIYRKDMVRLLILELIVKSVEEYIG